MLLTILRHAHALSEGYASDELRPLSKEGLDECAEMVAKLQKLKLIFTHAFSSPYLRAKETAEILASALGVENHSLISLGIPADKAAFVEQLHSLDQESCCLIICHMPFITEFLDSIVKNGTIGPCKPCEGALIETDPSVYPLQGKLILRF